MPARVQLIAGPAHSGKSQILIDNYRRRVSSQLLPENECYWIGPNQAAISQWREELLKNSSRALLRPNLVTFANFAERLIAGSSRNVRSVSPLQKRRLLQHVIQSLQEQQRFQHFAAVANTSGFVSQVAQFISDLKRSDIWPEEYERRCQSRPRSDRRAREYAAIYSGYQQLLHQHDLYDAEGRFWAAREILSEAPASQHQFDLLVIDGFNDFTTAQYDILRLLSQRSTEALISLALPESDNSAPLFTTARHTLACLQQALPQLEIHYQSTQPAASNSLHELQQRFIVNQEKLQIQTPVNTLFENVEILAAASELGENEAIAARIKALLFSRRAEPQEIIVVHRGGESSVTALIDTFADFGIPCYSELQPRLEVAPLVRGLLTVLQLHLDDWPFQRLLEVINNRLFTRFDEGIELTTDFATQNRVALEHCLRSVQIPVGKVPLLEQLDYRLKSLQSYDQREHKQREKQYEVALDQFRSLADILGQLPAEASLSDWTVVLHQMLSQLGMRGLTSENATTGITWGLLRRNLLAIERVDRLVQRKKRSFSLEEFRELLVTIAADQRLAAPHDDVGRVRILSAESARKLTIEHLFLAGLSEQAFSAAEAADQPQPGDQPNPPSQNDHNVPRRDSQLLFYELITSPIKSLTLSYPSLDSKGQPLPPSPLLTDLQHTVGPGRISLSTINLGQTAPADAPPLSQTDFRQQSVNQALAGKHQWLAGMMSHPSFRNVGNSILSGLESVAARSRREEFGPYEGLILGDSAQAALARRFDAEHLWSPSQLESYATCPFRYFAEQLLGLEPLNELAVRNDPRRRGSLLHHVLATIHAQLSEATELKSDELVERFLTTLEATVKATPLRGIEQSLREIERREIEAWAPDYAEQETKYRSQWKELDEPPRPAHFEVRFGPETRGSSADTPDRASTPVPFELDLGEQRIRLTGQIDRVDIGRVGDVTVFNIIDYKSGKEVRLHPDKVRSGHQLQLPLYALAAEKLLLAEQQAVALATGYWNIRGKGFGTSRSGPLQINELAGETVQPSRDWKQLQPQILQRVQELIDGIRLGQFPVYNADEQCTRSCSLSTVCRVGQIRNLEKVWPPDSMSGQENATGGNGGN